MYEEADKALSKAKIQLMANKEMTFVTTVVLSLKYEWDNTIKTACVDGTTMYLNPDFFLAHTTKQQIGLILHETWHVALKHMLRGEKKNEKKYNYAADYYINLMLTDNHIQIPPCGLLEEKYRGLSTDEIYDLLPDSIDFPDLLDIKFNKGKPEQDNLKNEIDNILIKAKIQAEMSNTAGNIPGELKIYLDNLLNPKLPWHVILRKYISNFSKNDYSWRKPNRRFFPEHYLPSLYSEALTDFAVALDLSGSVTDNQVKHFGSEVHRIFKDLNPKTITLITFDTKIRDIYPLTSASEMLRKELHGRGGTCVRDLMKHLQKTKPVVTVVLTDGEFDWTEVIDPKVPVVWVIHNNPYFKSPFGKVIHYELPN